MYFISGEIKMEGALRKSWGNYRVTMERYGAPS